VLTFATPAAINANTTYIASTHGTTYYATGNALLNAGVDNAPLHALKNGVDGPNAVFAYGAGTVFPNQSFNASNYWAGRRICCGADKLHQWQTQVRPRTTTVGAVFGAALQALVLDGSSNPANGVAVTFHGSSERSQRDVRRIDHGYGEHQRFRNRGNGDSNREQHCRKLQRHCIAGWRRVSHL
jgi:hypothetical protein